MTLDELIEELRVIRTSDEIGSIPVMSNHPGTGYPWGTIQEVTVLTPNPHSGFHCIFLDMGEE